MHKPLLAIGLALFTLLARAEVIDIDNGELEKLIKNGVPVIDIRTQAEWEDTGIISGSKLLTFFNERGQADTPAWLSKLSPIAKPNQPVILICRSGNRTRAASQFLSRDAGYAKVYNVKSGIKGWVGSGNPVVPANQTIAACRNARTC